MPNCLASLSLAPACRLTFAVAAVPMFFNGSVAASGIAVLAVLADSKMNGRDNRERILKIDNTFTAAKDNKKITSYNNENKNSKCYSHMTWSVRTFVGRLVGLS